MIGLSKSPTPPSSYNLITSVSIKIFCPVIRKEIYVRLYKVTWNVTHCTGEPDNAAVFKWKVSAGCQEWKRRMRSVESKLYISRK